MILRSHFWEPAPPPPRIYPQRRHLEHSSTQVQVLRGGDRDWGPRGSRQGPHLNDKCPVPYSGNLGQVTLRKAGEFAVLTAESQGFGMKKSL